MKYTVCVDPGHGGSDPGAVNGALYEKDVVLDVAKNLKAMLEKSGYKVYMTREDDTFLKPSGKAMAGNAAKADIFVSIHCNASVNKEANGTETLTYDDEGEGFLLGKNIQEGLISALRLKDRKVKVRKELTVLNSTNMPAALAEIAFITNGNEKKMLAEEGFRKKAAEGIFNGIEKYFGKGKKMTLEEAKKRLKEKFGFDDNTIKYLEFYRFGEELILRLAEKDA